MFGFPFYEQSPYGYQDGQRRRGTYPAYPQQRPVSYRYPQYEDQEEEEEEDAYSTQRQRQLRQQQLLQQQRQQELLRQQELQRQQELRQQELLRQRELQQRAELQRQRELQKAQQRYRQQQQQAARIQQESDEEESSEEEAAEEEEDEEDQEVPAFFRHAFPQRVTRNPFSNPKTAKTKKHPQRTSQGQYKDHPHVQSHPQPQPAPQPKKEINKDAVATKIQKVFKGWQVRKLRIIPKLRSIKVCSQFLVFYGVLTILQRVEDEVDSIVSRSTAILELPIDGSATLDANTQYVGTVPKPFLALELELTSKLIQLDEISGASPLVRTARKALVTKIEGINSKLDTLKKVYARVEPVVQETDATSTAAPMETEQESPVVPDVEVKDADTQDNEKLNFFRDGEQQPQAESQEPTGEAGFSGEEPLVQPVEEESQESSSSTEQEMPHVEDADTDSDFTLLPTEEAAPLLKDEATETDELELEPEPIEAEPLPSSVTSTPDPETTSLIDAAAPTPTSTLPDVPMEDEWVHMEASTPTTTTQPTATTATITQQLQDTHIQQIPTLKRMCYNLCNQLLQKAIASEPVH